MAIAFTISKIKASSSRKLPLLPRLGLVVDFAGMQVAIRSVPMIETLLAARAKGGISLNNLRTVATEALEEVRMPAAIGRGLAVVQSLGAKAKTKAVKKSAAKAAAERKPAAEKKETDQKDAKDAKHAKAAAPAT
jgi:long-subunit acyl-CoA synthetase (AMP-forming)